MRQIGSYYFYTNIVGLLDVFCTVLKRMCVYLQASEVIVGLDLNMQNLTCAVNDAQT